MVINREFFFRGWLPAGLLINARLSSSSTSDEDTVLRPLLNPSPANSWPRQQPPIVFPVSQATDTKAVLLKDVFPDGAIVMLPLGAWYGPGTPFILATNVWYEGRIQEVSGGDVMSVRVGVDRAFTLNYYSYYSGIADADVKLAMMPCKWIQGRARDQRAFKDTDSVLSETGYFPTVKVADSDVALPILDVKRISTVELAGMTMAFSSQSPSSEAHFIQCEVIAGLDPRTPGTKYIGLIGSVEPYVQNFYTMLGDGIKTRLSGAGLVKSQTVGVVSLGSSDDPVVHYN